MWRARAGPLLHYLHFGAAEGRNPHPEFDAAWYVVQHPEAAENPLLHHMRVRRHRGWPTAPVVAIADYLPSTRPAPLLPARVTVDIVIPVYRGLEETRRCLESVLADRRVRAATSSCWTTARRSRNCPAGSTRWRLPAASGCCATRRIWASFAA